MKRLQRLRATSPLRELIAEVGFGQAQLIQPLFAVEGISTAQLVPGLGDNARLPLAELGPQIDRDLSAGVRNFILFAVSATRAESWCSFHITIFVNEKMRHICLYEGFRLRWNRNILCNACQSLFSFSFQ